MDSASGTRSRSWTPAAAVTAIVVGVALRALLYAASFGTSDVNTIAAMGERIDRLGLVESYIPDKFFNHPPIPSLWFAAAWKISQNSGISIAHVAKMPALVGEILSLWLIWLIWRRRGGRDMGLVAAGVYACHPVGMLVSSYHGNTDPAYAALTLLAAWLLPARPLLAGLALGAAINIKLVPGPMILVLLACCRDWRSAGRFAAGLAIASIPFIWLAWEISPIRFKRNLLSYGGLIGPWGPCGWLNAIAEHPVLGEWAREARWSYYARGRWLMLGVVALVALRWRTAGLRDAMRGAAVASAAMLVVSPAYAPQYLALVAPLLAAVSLRWSILFGITGGLCLLADYVRGWDGTFPIASLTVQPGYEAFVVFATLAWATLACFAWLGFRSARSTASRPAQPADMRDCERPVSP